MKNSPSLSAKALDLLARRDYSYHELYQKLLKYSSDQTEIEAVLNEMVTKRFLNEERFIENFIYSKSQKYGSRKVRYLLAAKIGTHEQMDELYQPDYAAEIALAKKLWRRKFSANVAEDHKAYARQINFLLNRGFSLTIAKQVVANNDIQISDEECQDDVSAHT